MTWLANESSSQGKGKLLMVALNDRRAALAERTAAVSRSVPASCPVIASDELILSSWFSAFQTEITTLIPLYINHTDSGGDWEGESAIANVAPAWTEATILTAIGASRIAAPVDPLISAAWLYQQYKIINMLRWVHSSSYNADPTIESTNERTGGSGDEASGQEAYDAALADWNGNSWGSFLTPRIEAASSVYYDGSIYRGVIATRRSAPKWNNTTDFDISTQLYCYSRDWSGLATSKTYEDSTGKGLAKDVFGIITSGGVSANTDHTFATITPAPPSNPSDPGSGETNLNGFQYDVFSSIERRWVLKFDGASGFTYKGW